MSASDDWPGVFELEALALEIRLNDPRTVSLAPPARIVIDDASFDALSATLAHPPPPNATLRALFKK